MLSLQDTSRSSDNQENKKNLYAPMARAWALFVLFQSAKKQFHYRSVWLHNLNCLFETKYATENIDMTSPVGWRRKHQITMLSFSDLSKVFLI